MKPSLLPLPFPLSGVDVSSAVENQRPRTTPKAQNARGYVPRTGRMQGGQRDGIRKYCPVQINSSLPIQNLQYCLTNLSSPNSGTQPTNADVAAFAYVDVFVGGSLVDHTAATSLLETGGLSGPSCAGCCWDGVGNAYYLLIKTGQAYVAKVSPVNGLVWLSAAMGPPPSFVDGLGGTWGSQGYGNGGPFASEQGGLCYDGANIWAMIPSTYTSQEPGFGPVTSYSSDLAQIDAATGQLINLFDLANDATNPVPFSTLMGQDYAQRNIGVKQGGNRMAYANGTLAVGTSIGGAILLLLINVQTLSYIKAINAVVLTVTGGVRGVCTDGTHFYLAAGNNLDAIGSNTSHVYKINADGTTAWHVTLTQNGVCGITYEPVGGRLFVAFTNTAFGAGADGNPVWVLSAVDGSKVTSFQPNDGANFATVGIDMAADGLGNVLLLHSGLYDIWNTTSAGVFNWKQTSNASKGNATMFAVNTKTNPTGPQTPVSVGGLRLRNLAVCGGTVKRFDRVGAYAVTNGPGALLNTALQVFSDQMLQKVHFVDGMVYKYYDIPSDSVLTLTPSAGSLPVDVSGRAARLQAVWRNRLVLSGLPQDPNNWFMSAVGDPTNWAYNPTPAVETQAVAGNNSTASYHSDCINCLIPYNDEILIMGGQATIYQMTGDPAAGGRIDPVSLEIGIAWGRPYCRDGQGVIYFLSSQGSIYKYVPGGLPERISDSILQLLQGRDLTPANAIEHMTWDESLLGFHVWFTPTAINTDTTHWFYDVRNQAWWPDNFTNRNHNPRCSLTLDGLTGTERSLLVGTRDGYVQELTPLALDDDGTAINSYVLLGPIRDKNGLKLFVADLIASLDLTSGAANWSVFSGSNAQAALNSAAVQAGTWRAGRNRSQPLNRSGWGFYVQVGSNTVGSAWSMEAVVARMRTFQPLVQF